MLQELDERRTVALGPVDVPHTAETASRVRLAVETASPVRLAVGTNTCLPIDAQTASRDGLAVETATRLSIAAENSGRVPLAAPRATVLCVVVAGDLCGIREPQRLAPWRGDLLDRLPEYRSGQCRNGEVAGDRAVAVVVHRQANASLRAGFLTAQLCILVGQRLCRGPLSRQQGTSGGPSELGRVDVLRLGDKSRLDPRAFVFCQRLRQATRSSRDDTRVCGRELAVGQRVLRQRQRRLQGGGERDIGRGFPAPGPGVRGEPRRRARHACSSPGILLVGSRDEGELEGLHAGDRPVDLRDIPPAHRTHGGRVHLVQNGMHAGNTLHHRHRAGCLGGKRRCHSFTIIECTYDIRLDQMVVDTSDTAARQWTAPPSACSPPLRRPACSNSAPTDGE